MKKTKIIFIAISMVMFFFDFGETGGFHSSTNNQIDDLKRKLDKASETIELLSQSNSDARIEAQQTISNLERNIANLQKELDDRQQNSSQNIAVWEQRVQDLTAQVNDLLERTLPYDCIKNIQDRQFEAAGKKLALLRQNETIISDIINQVYGGRIENVRLLNDLGKSFMSITLTLDVYKPLANTISANIVTSHIDALIDLLKSVEKEIINQSRVSDDIKVEAITVKNKLRDSIKKTGAKILVDAMLDNRLTTELNVAMSFVDSNLFFDAITDAMDKIYGNLDTNKILDYILKFEYVSQTMDGYTALFNEMKNVNSDLHRDEIVELVFRIQEYRKQSNYGNVVWGRFQEIKDGLPPSLSALAFSTSVCLKNVRYDEYLFVGRYTRDSIQRYALTWQPGVQVCQASWIIERRSGHLSIKNVNYDEYLFYSTYYNFKMFTWMAKSDIVLNKWKIKSTPFGVRLTNTVDEQVSIAADVDIYMEDRRHVVAKKPYETEFRSDIWKIEECNFKC